MRQKRKKWVKLSTDEKTILQNYFKYSPLVTIRLKAHVVLLKDAGISGLNVSMAIDRDIRTLERWIKDFSETRLASIFTGHEHNQNAAKLTKEQKLEIKEVLSKPPSEYGLPKEFWDVPQLKSYIQAEFGVVYESVQSYHFLLKFSDLSFKYPDKFSVRRDEVLVQNKLQTIRAEIADYLTDPNWEVFASDEVRIQLEAITRRAWLKKGAKTVVKVERSKDYQNYLGFLNQKTFVCHVFEIAWGRAEEIVKATAEFLKLYPQRQICIIWDNANCHKGKLLRKELKKGGLLEAVHLITFAPYAPDTNPIEHVWNTTKATLSNHQYPNFADTKHAFKNLILNQTYPYQI